MYPNVINSGFYRLCEPSEAINYPLRSPLRMYILIIFLRPIKKAFDEIESLSYEYVFNLMHI